MTDTVDLAVSISWVWVIAGALLLSAILMFATRKSNPGVSIFAFIIWIAAVMLVLYHALRGEVLLSPMLSDLGLLPPTVVGIIGLVAGFIASIVLVARKK